MRQSPKFRSALAAEVNRLVASVAGAEGISTCSPARLKACTTQMSSGYIFKLSHHRTGLQLTKVAGNVTLVASHLLEEIFP